MGDRLTQGSLARGMSKLDARRARRAHAARRRSLATARSFRTDARCPRTPISSLDLVRGAARRPAKTQLTCVEKNGCSMPGIFFDVNPFHRRRFHKSPYIDKLRMSYGPAWPNLKQAVKGMKEIIDLAKAGQLPPLDEPPPTA